MIRILGFFIGMCSGGMVAAGLFSFIITIGAMVRIIGKLQLEDRSVFFENCILAGIIIGNIITLFAVRPGLYLPHWAGVLIMGVFGLFAGVFIGVVFMSLAETLNALPVFERNLHLKSGMKYIVFAMAIGKLVGSWFDFWAS